MSTTISQVEAAEQDAAERRVRAGIFSSVPAAERAVQMLREAGFSVEEITVVCSDAIKERFFGEFEHQQPAGTTTPAGAALGGAVGATVFGLTAVIVGAATGGGLPLLIAGGWGIWTGAVAGGFVGAMMTRGVEKELANFYEEAVTAGKLLVAVELHGEHIRARLGLAETLLAAAGAEPMALSEG